MQNRYYNNYGNYSPGYYNQSNNPGYYNQNNVQGYYNQDNNSGYYGQSNNYGYYNQSNNNGYYNQNYYNQQYNNQYQQTPYNNYGYNYQYQAPKNNNSRKIIIVIAISFVFIMACIFGVIEIGRNVKNQNIKSNNNNPAVIVRKRNTHQIHTERGFINQIRKPAQLEYEKNYQVVPSIVIAQAIIESNYGKSKLYTKANNPFGIKWNHQGQYITYKTKEDYNGNYETVKAKFAKYPNVRDAIIEHNKLLTQYYLKHHDVRNPTKAAELLQEHGYATNENYSNEITEMVKRWHLKKYDKV